MAQVMHSVNESGACYAQHVVLFALPMLEKSRTRILALLDRPHMTKALIAERAGVHRNTLNGVENGHWNPRAKTLEAIMGAVERLEKA